MPIEPSDWFAVLHEQDRPHGVTVASTPAGVELWRISTTGRLTMFLVLDSELAAVRAALEKWEAAHG